MGRSGGFQSSNNTTSAGSPAADCAAVEQWCIHWAAPGPRPGQHKNLETSLVKAWLLWQLELENCADDRDKQRSEALLEMNWVLIFPHGGSKNDEADDCC